MSNNIISDATSQGVINFSSNDTINLNAPNINFNGNIKYVGEMIQGVGLIPSFIPPFNIPEIPNVTSYAYNLVSNKVSEVFDSGGSIFGSVRNFPDSFLNKIKDISIGRSLSDIFTSSSISDLLSDISNPISGITDSIMREIDNLVNSFNFNRIVEGVINDFTPQFMKEISSNSLLLPRNLLSANFNDIMNGMASSLIDGRGIMGFINDPYPLYPMIRMGNIFSKDSLMLKVAGASLLGASLISGKIKPFENSSFPKLSDIGGDFTNPFNVFNGNYAKGSVFSVVSGLLDGPQRKNDGETSTPKIGTLIAQPIYIRLIAGSSIKGDTVNLDYGLYDSQSGGNLITDARPTGSAVWKNAPNETSNVGSYFVTYLSGISIGNTAYFLNIGASVEWKITSVDPTSTPTSTPTDAPTSTPTSTPTDAPTSTPTVAPTVEPTSSPTDTPTVAPTVEPTSSPTSDVEQAQCPTCVDNTGSRVVVTDESNSSQYIILEDNLSDMILNRPVENITVTNGYLIAGDITGGIVLDMIDNGDGTFLIEVANMTARNAIIAGFDNYNDIAPVVVNLSAEESTPITEISRGITARGILTLENTVNIR